MEPMDLCFQESFLMEESWSWTERSTYCRRYIMQNGLYLVREYLSWEGLCFRMAGLLGSWNIVSRAVVD